METTIGEKKKENAPCFASLYGFSASTFPLFKLRLVTSRPDYLFLPCDEREDPHPRPPLFFMILRGDGDVARGREEGRKGGMGFSGLETRLALFRNDVAAFPRRRKRDSASWRTRHASARSTGKRGEGKKGGRREGEREVGGRCIQGMHTNSVRYLDTRYAKYIRDSRNFQVWKLTNG